MRHSMMWLCVLGLSTATAAHAQGCFGQAEFDQGSYRLGAMARTTSEANEYGLTLATGEPGSQFLDGHIGRATLSSTPLTVTSWGLRTGGQIMFRGAGAGQLCPYAAVENAEGSYMNATNVKVGTKVQSYALGAAYGMRLWGSDEVEVRPTLGAEIRFVSGAGAIDYEGVAGSTRISNTSYEAITLGVGIVIRGQISLRPTFTQPVGLPSAKSAVGLSAAWTFGGR